MTETADKALSPKVVAGTAGAGAGAIVTALVTWLVGAAYAGDWTAGGVETALASVPAPLVAFIGLVVGVAFTFVPAYFIRDHLREEGARIERLPGAIPGEVESAVDARVEPVEDPVPDVEVYNTGALPYTGERGK